MPTDPKKVDVGKKKIGSRYFYHAVKHCLGTSGWAAVVSPSVLGDKKGQVAAMAAAFSPQFSPSFGGHNLCVTIGCPSVRFSNIQGA